MAPSPQSSRTPGVSGSASSTSVTTSAVAAAQATTLAVAVADSALDPPWLPGPGAVTQPLSDADHLAVLVLVGEHLAVALDLHRLDSICLSTGSSHDPGSNLVADLHTSLALTCGTEPESHLLALARPDHEVVEFTLILGLLLLLDLNDLPLYLP